MRREKKTQENAEIVFSVRKFFKSFLEILILEFSDTFLLKGTNVNAFHMLTFNAMGAKSERKLLAHPSQCALTTLKDNLPYDYSK